MIIINEKRYILDRCEKTDSGCWVWKLSLDAQGYGQAVVNYERIKAHRLSYRAFVGPLTKGFGILHHCDNPACCNPKHLYEGTQARNMLDAKERGRMQGIHAGEGTNTAKLTWPDVDRIREEAKQGHPLVAIAKEYGMHSTTIGSLVAGKTWKECYR